MSTNSKQVFSNRVLKVAYWNVDPRILTAGVAELESLLRRLADVKIQSVKSLESIAGQSFDLLICSAAQVPDEEFARWLDALSKRMEALSNVWVPALILAPVHSADLTAILMASVMSNWYFDILDPNHLGSLPMRVANLIRIHDHLRELFRYEETLKALQDRVIGLEDEVAKLRP